MSLIIEKEKIFFHIPKTGGNSFRSFIQSNSNLQLKEISHKHATPDFFEGSSKYHFRQKLFHINGQNLQGIVFVRNPYTWYESWYKYQISRGVVKWGGSRTGSHWHPMSTLDYVDYSSFDSFIESTYERYPAFLTGLFSRYLAGFNSVINRMEDVVLNTEGELMKMGLDPSKFSDTTFPVVRPSPELNIVWRKSLKNKVRENESALLERFQYEF
jgi:hypothetical protein